MPVAQSEIAQSETAFRSHLSARSVALPAPPGPIQPARQKPAGRERRARMLRRMQTLWLTMIVVVACCAVTVGLAYLSSYARLTREGYRRDRLLRGLVTEQNRYHQLEQLKTMLKSPIVIERKAHQLHMVRADDSETVSLREEF